MYYYCCYCVHVLNSVITVIVLDACVLHIVTVYMCLTQLLLLLFWMRACYRSTATVSGWS